MLKRLIPLIFVSIAAVSLTSCGLFGGTGVAGKVILEVGQTGDVRNARIELYETSDLTGDPVVVGQAESSGTDQTEAEFELTDILAGYYYLLAWKDVDGDGEISDLDLVGVYGGTYTDGDGGQKLTVEDGKITDVGDITMMIYIEPLAVIASGSIADMGYTVSYTYTFNHDVTLNTFSVTIPGYAAYPDPEEYGTRSGGQSYTTTKYIIDGGSVPIPSGIHTLRFQGTADGDPFDITVDVTL